MRYIETLEWNTSLFRLITKPIVKKISAGLIDLSDMSEAEINAIPEEELIYYHDSKYEKKLVGVAIVLAILLLVGVISIVKAMLF